MSNFPGDPYSDKVDEHPCWAAIPKQSMQTVWLELHRTEKSRKDMIDRLKRINPKVWLNICRDKACVGMDLRVWIGLVRMLALEASEEELKEACPLPEKDDEDDAIELARNVLKDAVRGVLEIDDKERVMAANMILRMKSTKVSDNIINVMTGVPRHEVSTTKPDSGGVLQHAGDGGSGEDGGTGFTGIAGIDRPGEAGGSEEDYSRA